MWLGYRIEQGGSTMVFAADSRPCQGVVEHAKGADLLIHEAYGTSGEAEAAHSGPLHGGRRRCGRPRGRVGRLVLTHIQGEPVRRPRG